MVRTQIIDQSNDLSIADTVIEVLESEGYPAEEIIAGLCMAITLLAEKTFDPERAIDEAVSILDDEEILMQRTGEDTV